MNKLAYAFVIGGVFGVIGQLLIFLWAAIVGEGNILVNPLTMASMGVIGLVLFVSGISDKLEERTAMGVTIPISGMVIAIGNATYGTKRATGSAAAGAKAGAGLPLRVLGIGAGLSVVLCAVLFFTTHGTLELSYEQIYLNKGLDTVLAFIVGGLLSLIAEAILLATKAPIPVLLIIFIVVGALLAAFNIDGLPFLTNGGFVVSLLAAGQAAYETFQVLLMGVTPVPFCIVLCVYLCVTVLGIIAGLVKR